MLDDVSRWQWHAYDYGWRRVVLQTRDDQSPIDPAGKWYDDRLVAEAEIMWCHELGKPAPPLVDDRPAINWADRQMHRQSLAPLWDLVRRAKAGESAEVLIRERKRITAEAFAANPRLREIDERIQSEVIAECGNNAKFRALERLG